MLKEILFTVYAALIPAVPLWGAHYYSKNDNTGRKTLCYILFALQVLLSAGSIMKFLDVI